MNKKAILAVSLLAVSSTAVNAKDVVDFQIWNPIIANVKFGPHFRGYGEIQTRVDVNSDSVNLNQVIVRPALGYAFNEHSSLWLGYTMNAELEWNSTSTYGVENVAWQGFTWNDTYGKQLSYEVRNRIEERFLPNTSDVAYRWRTRIRMEYLFGEKSDWSGIASDEFFIALNNVADPQYAASGFSQNRAYLGVGYRFMPEFQVETGVLQQYLWRDSGKNNMNDIVWMTSFNLSF